VAGRLGTASLAAHQVVAQLWMLTAYVADGIGVAGTVLGSRLTALPDLQVHRCRRRACFPACMPAAAAAG
jgi:hypothetical protein